MVGGVGGAGPAGRVDHRDLEPLGDLGQLGVGRGRLRQLGEHKLDDGGGDAARPLDRWCRSPCRRGTGWCRRAAACGELARSPTRQTRHAPNGAWRSSKHSVGTHAPACVAALEDRGALRDLELGAVDGDGDHASPNSSGKWASRLRNGRASLTPWAHRLPSSSASSSCSKLARSTGAVGGEHVVGAAQPDPAGEALAAALVRAEAQQVHGQRPDVGLVVKGADRAMADHAALGGQRVEVKRGVELGRGQDPAQRAADLDRLDRAGRHAGRRRRPRTARASSSRTGPRRRSAARSAR